MLIIHLSVHINISTNVGIYFTVLSVCLILNPALYKSTKISYKKSRNIEHKCLTAERERELMKKCISRVLPGNTCFTFNKY